MEELKTSKFPLNFAALKKETLITQAEIENILGFTQESDPEEYKCQQFRLYGRVESYLESTGLDVTVTHRGYCILICGDSEALHINHKRFKQHFKGMIKATRKTGAIDRDNLIDPEKRAHENNMLYMNRITCAAIKADKVRRIG